MTGFSLDEIDALFDDSIEDEDNPYTDKINVPQYEVQGINPALSKCFDDTKAKELINELENADISEEEKEFLTKAAYRHIAFNYANVAEYYAGASKEVQSLMEKSGLVIIDFDNAMRNGFVRLSKELKKEAGLNDAS